MPKILYNETKMTVILCGGKIKLYPKGSTNPACPDHRQVDNELSKHPDIVHFYKLGRVAVLSMDDAKAREDADKLLAQNALLPPPVVAEVSAEPEVPQKEEVIPAEAEKPVEPAKEEKEEAPALDEELASEEKSIKGKSRKRR